MAAVGFFLTPEQLFGGFDRVMSTFFLSRGMGLVLIKASAQFP